MGNKKFTIGFINWSSHFVLSVIVLNLIYSVFNNNYELSSENIIFLFLFFLTSLVALINPKLGRFFLLTLTFFLSISLINGWSTTNETVSFFFRIGSMKISTPHISISMLLLFIWCSVTNLDIIKMIFSSIKKIIYYGVEN